ncbi:MAG: DNA alkylation repair protein [archaeon]|nr:DNA alkylation repair protein [archaeon]
MNGEEMEALLRSLAEPEFQKFTAKLMPGTDNVLGIRLPKLRQIAKEICKGDWREFLTHPSHIFEHTLIRAFVIAGAKMDVDERIERTMAFIPEVTNWAINDSFCCSWKFGKKDSEKVWNMCMELLDRREEFPSRVGAVMLMDHFLDDEHIDSVVERLVSLPRCGYYLDMGVAWALSFCFIKYPRETEDRLFDGRLETEVLTMTVRKICDSYRVEKSEKEKLKGRLRETRARAPVTRRSS